MKTLIPPQLVRVLTFVAALVSPISLGGQALASTSAATTLNQTISGGLLSLSSTNNAHLDPIVIEHAGINFSRGTLGDVLVDDSRGSNAGWTASATVSNFTSTVGFTHDGAANTPFSLLGQSTNLAATSGTYTLTIVNGGRLGVATYAISGQLTTPTTNLAATQTLGNTGFSFQASDVTYTAGDQFQLKLDIMPVSDLTIAPVAPVATSGSLAGVVAGDSHVFTSPNDPVTLATAANGNGDGLYDLSANLRLDVSPNANPGSYSAIVTETIN